MIKAIVSDLDGTLLNSHHRLGNFTHEVLEKLVARGLKLILASGRPWADVEAIRQQINTEMFLITSNGARVHDRDGHCVFRHDLPVSVAEQLWALQQPDCHINVYRDNDWLVRKANPELLKYHKDSGFTYQVIDQQDFNGEHAAKIFWIGEPAALKQVEHKIREQFASQVAVAYSSPLSLEVMAASVSKGEALKLVAEAKGIETAQILAFGDGQNDLEMLQEAGEGIRMGNAHPKLNEALPHLPQIGSHEEEAVARYLAERFF